MNIQIQRIHPRPSRLVPYILHKASRKLWFVKHVNLVQPVFELDRPLSMQCWDEFLYEEYMVAKPVFACCKNYNTHLDLILKFLTNERQKLF